MINFNSLTASIISNTVEALIAIVNIYLIIVIWKFSPKAMGSFKIYLLKLAITDFVFSFSLGWLLLPNLLFPLPAFTCGGLLKYFGPVGLKLANILTFCSGEITLISVNDCCLYRFFVFYKFDRALEGFTGLPGVTFFFCFNGVACIAIVIAFLWNSAGYEELTQYAVRHNLTDYMHKISSSTPLYMFNGDDIFDILGALVAALWLLGTEGWNVTLSGAVLYKVQQSKASMSKETYKLQKSLTYVLLVQAILPFASVTGPMCTFTVTLLLNWVSVTQSDWFQYGTVAIIGCYPLVNSFFCLYCMKPYRTFTIRLLKKIFRFWKKNVTAVTEISRHDATSSNLV